MEKKKKIKRSTNKLTSVFPVGALKKPSSLQQNLYISQKSVDLLHVGVFGVEDVIERATRHLEILLIQERRLGIKKELLILQTSRLSLTFGHFFPPHFLVCVACVLVDVLSAINSEAATTGCCSCQMVPLFLFLFFYECGVFNMEQWPMSVDGGARENQSPAPLCLRCPQGPCARPPSIAVAQSKRQQINVHRCMIITQLQHAIIFTILIEIFI